jgi:hypothetical protein
MASLQFQDIAVQASMGTDALRIMTMQGPQLASVFGPSGMIVGALVAVGGALAMMGGESSLASRAFDVLRGSSYKANEALDAIRAETAKYNAELELLESGLDTVAQLQMQKAIASLKEAIAQKELRLQEEQTQRGRNNTSREVKASLDLLVQQLGVLYAEDAANKEALETLNAKNKAIREAGQSSSKTAKIIRTELTPEIKRMNEAGNMVGSSFETAFMSVIKGTMSAKEAFRSMAANIIAELFRIFVVKKITGFISNMVSFGLGPKTGNTGSLGLPSFNGGGYTGSGPRSGGLDGRGGFMAMLHPNESVVDHTKGGAGVVVNQTINVTTGVQQTVRNEIQSLLPQIAEASKAAVMDARKRGGSFANAF